MAGPATLFQSGDHASRPAVDAGCVLYWCTDHDIFYRSNGAAWSTWSDLSAIGGAPSFAAWADYTPAWTASSSNPTLGSSTIVGRYLIAGKVCFFNARLTIVSGGAFNVGSGNYAISLPPGATAKSGKHPQVVTAYSLDAGNVHRRGVGLVPTAGTTISASHFDDSGSQWNNAGPTVPANGDIFEWQGTIEID